MKAGTESRSLMIVTLLHSPPSVHGSESIAARPGAQRVPLCRRKRRATSRSARAGYRRTYSSNRGNSPWILPRQKHTPIRESESLSPLRDAGRGRRPLPSLQVAGADGGPVRSPRIDLDGRVRDATRGDLLSRLRIGFVHANRQPHQIRPPELVRQPLQLVVTQEPHCRCPSHAIRAGFAARAADR
jgi:hypothetical protein